MAILVVERKRSGKGKKNRKFNRRKKKPCQQRYTANRQWNTNKRRKAQKYAKRMNQVVRIKIDGEWETIHPIKKAGGDSSPA